MIACMDLHEIDPRGILFSVLARCVTVGVLLSAAFGAYAQQYRWLDEKGRVQYTDTPPPPHAKGVEKKILRVGPAGDGQEPFALQTARKNSPVKLYSSADCGSICDEARKLLNERGIPFREISVTTVDQLEELKSASGGSIVPVMLVGSSVQKGFEAANYNGALDAAGYPRAGSPRTASQTPPPPSKTPAGAPSVPAGAPGESGGPAKAAPR